MNSLIHIVALGLRCLAAGCAVGACLLMLSGVLTMGSNSFPGVAALCGLAVVPVWQTGNALDAFRTRRIRQHLRSLLLKAGNAADALQGLAVEAGETQSANEARREPVS